MAYSGTYKPINREKYKGDPNNITWRSKWEYYCFKWADTSPNVKSWSSEEVVVPYIWDVDKRAHRYFIDMKITFTDGKTILLEIKPYKETQKPKYPGRKTKNYLNESMTYVKNQNKWKAADSYAKDRGWEFVIWTENELTEMGIMPKGNISKFKSLGQPFKKQKAPPKGKGLKMGPKPYKKFTKK